MLKNLTVCPDFKKVKYITVRINLTVMRRKIQYSRINFPDESIIPNIACVYKIWYNNHYYIGFTTDLNKRVHSHMCFVKRYVATGKASNTNIKGVYRKLVKLLLQEVYLKIKIEILLQDVSIEKLKQHEIDLLYDKHIILCPYSLNNVRKALA